MSSVTSLASYAFMYFGLLFLTKPMRPVYALCGSIEVYGLPTVVAVLC